MRFIIYRDLANENLKGYSISIAEASSYVVREMVIPGMQGMKPIYIRHIKADDLFIVTQTNDELTDDIRTEILAGAKEFLAHQDQSN